MKKILLFSFIICLCTSCSNFYKAITTSGKPTATRVEELKDQQKYFILRDDARAYGMNNITISKDGQDIECDLASLPDEHLTHMWKPKEERPTYQKADAKYVLNEVHLYTIPDSNRAPGHYKFSLSSVVKTEMLQKDIVRTRNNHIRAVVFSIGGTALLLLGIGYAALSTIPIF